MKATAWLSPRRGEALSGSRTVPCRAAAVAVVGAGWPLGRGGAAAAAALRRGAVREDIGSGRVPTPDTPVMSAHPPPAVATVRARAVRGRLHRQPEPREPGHGRPRAVRGSGLRRRRHAVVGPRRMAGDRLHGARSAAGARPVVAAPARRAAGDGGAGSRRRPAGGAPHGRARPARGGVARRLLDARFAGGAARNGGPAAAHRAAPPRRRGRAACSATRSGGSWPPPWPRRCGATGSRSSTTRSSGIERPAHRPVRYSAGVRLLIRSKTRLRTAGSVMR